MTSTISPAVVADKTQREPGQAKATMGAVLTRLLEVFYTKKLDIVVIGLENRYASFLLDHASCSISVRHAERSGARSGMCGLRISGTYS